MSTPAAISPAMIVPKPPVRLPINPARIEASRQRRTP